MFSESKPYAVITLGSFFVAGKKSQAAVALIDSLYGGFQFASRASGRAEAPAQAFWFVFPPGYLPKEATQILKNCFPGWGEDCTIKSASARYLETIGAWPKPAFYIRGLHESMWPDVNNVVMDMRNYK